MRSASDPRRRAALAVLPLGATEQHGPHLTTTTDTVLAESTARVLAGSDPGPGGAVLLPALAYGASGEHEGFAGTVSIGTEVTAAVVTEIGRSVSAWADRLVVVNGHGGNVDALRTAVPLLRREGRDAAWLPCRTAERDTDTHAGHAETSLLLHLSPELVDRAAARPGDTRPLREILPALRSGGVAAVSSTGVLGDPTTASAAEGERLWAALVADARARLERWHPDPAGMLR